jgi:hypothetical protein
VVGGGLTVDRETPAIKDYRGSKSKELHTAFLLDH